MKGPELGDHQRSGHSCNEGNYGCRYGDPEREHLNSSTRFRTTDQCDLIITSLICVIVGGVLQAFHAFGSRAWGGFFIDLLAGILYVVAGFLIVANPAATAVSLTLLISMFLIFGGIFRMVMAVARVVMVVVPCAVCVAGVVIGVGITGAMLLVAVKMDVWQCRQ